MDQSFDDHGEFDLVSHEGRAPFEAQGGHGDSPTIVDGAHHVGEGDSDVVVEDLAEVGDVAHRLDPTHLNAG